MTIGTSVPLPATYDPAVIAKEDLGYDSIGTRNIQQCRLTTPVPGDGVKFRTILYGDPYIALAQASSVTSTIKLATGITLVPERNPLLLAKEISVLDLHSGAGSSLALVLAG